ncbi:galactose mutarotase-like domain-containing protein [Tricharina praecox]|uniref:galactose mutarotase-like domain-containing protein n=1 Tax=Tricharina praecox TaxID=43433 RepID=UPI002220A274|nr:galactose mutarotase-like domain-containing protein [Tricharina praecox]KAI5854580.1 galactose mutarotase-like domain-containing protein [Tricharina praecox]
MVERGHKPDALAVAHTTDIGHASGVSIESDRVKLSLPSGESAEILLYGATVISWKAGGEEKLFLSDKAKLDGTKAIRGGIPLVFPVFGKTTEGPTAALPQHGFARISKWELLGKTSESNTSVQVDFGLGPENLTVDARKQWPYDFGLIYSVVLGKTSLETKMLVRNEGGESFDFNVLFHTYLRVPDVTTVSVSGLKGVTYKDKVLKGAMATEESESVTIAAEVDRAYENVPGAVTVNADGKTLFKVERTNLEDVVVWNPWEGASGMADFGPADGYKNMLCVEAGAVANWHTLETQNVWECGVTVHI